MNKNIDKGGIFKNYSANTRFLLFYCICIWFRLLLAFVVYKLSNKKSIILTVFIIALLSIFKNFYTSGSVWWCRACHGFISIILVLCALLSLLDYINGKYISYILVFDVIFGILYTLNKRPFNKEYI